jgi:hypothetical protein
MIDALLGFYALPLLFSSAPSRYVSELQWLYALAARSILFVAG